MHPRTRRAAKQNWTVPETGAITIPTGCTPPTIRPEGDLSANRALRISFEMPAAVVRIWLRLAVSPCSSRLSGGISLSGSGQAPNFPINLAHLGFWGDGGVSCDQGGDEGSEEGFSASSGVVDELEEAEVEGQLLLRDAAVGAQPGAQQRPEASRVLTWTSQKPSPSSSRATPPRHGRPICDHSPSSPGGHRCRIRRYRSGCPG